MAKKKLEANIGHLDKATEAVAEILGLSEEKRPYKITAASLWDGFCNYSYEVIEGVGLGDKPNVKGGGIVKPDMEEAFGKLRVHLAVIDDVYKHSNIEIDDIDNYHTHDLTWLYFVSGIKISGSEDSETVSVTGSKHIDCAGGRITVTTPKIAIDNLSSYKWHNELKAIIDLIREEVSLYKEGKCTLPDSEEEEETHKAKSRRLKQLTIGDEISEREKEAADQETEEEVEDVDLESNRV